jgi:hypothetical protein
LLLYIKDHGEALLDKYPISNVVSCEREVSDDDELTIVIQTVSCGYWKINHFIAVTTIILNDVEVYNKYSFK